MRVEGVDNNQSIAMGGAAVDRVQLVERLRAAQISPMFVWRHAVGQDRQSVRLTKGAIAGGSSFNPQPEEAAG